MCCGVEGFNLDLGASRHAFICDYAITPPAHTTLCTTELCPPKLQRRWALVETTGNAPVLPGFNGTLLLS